MSPLELGLARFVVDGGSGSDAEKWWADQKRPMRQLWSILDKWSDWGWWDYGVSIRGGWLTEVGREELLRRLNG